MTKKPVNKDISQMTEIHFVISKNHKIAPFRLQIVGHISVIWTEVYRGHPIMHPMNKSMLVVHNGASARRGKGNTFLH